MYKDRRYRDMREALDDINAISENLASQGIDSVQCRTTKLKMLQEELEAVCEEEYNILRAKKNIKKAESGEDTHKLEHCEECLTENDAIRLDQVAAALDIPNMTSKDIFELLRKKRVLNEDNQPSRVYQDAGYFRLLESIYTDTRATRHHHIITLVFPQGLEFIRQLIERGVE